jgi:hypothetical protein
MDRFSSCRFAKPRGGLFLRNICSYCFADPCHAVTGRADKLVKISVLNELLEEIARLFAVQADFVHTFLWFAQRAFAASRAFALRLFLLSFFLVANAPNRPASDVSISQGYHTSRCSALGC